MAVTMDEMTTVDARGRAATTAWRRALPAAGLALGVLFALFWDTAASIVAIWARSDTFAHGYVIVPISAWLIWRQRDALAVVAPRPGLLALPLLVLTGFVWLLARLTGVLVVEQLAFVSLVPLTLWAVLGWPVVRTVLFPLVFLFFAVPMGEELIPPMMDFTAAFTVRALQLTGIPVYWEGTFFTIPSGQWSVVEGCSGVRYLIASFTLGTLYAYLTYRSYWRRAVFIALSAVVPVFANGMRAYLIVMIAHLSDMQLAMGVDHFIYGWVFFGIVMLLLFAIGSIWREDHLPEPPPAASPAAAAGSRGAGLATLGVTLALLALWPAVHAVTRGAPADQRAVALQAPAPERGWALAGGPLTDWEPHYVGPDAVLHRSYRREGRTVGLYLAFYAEQSQGREVINAQNVLLQFRHPKYRPKWRIPHEGRRSVQLGTRAASVEEATMRADGEGLLVWRWYWIGGYMTGNPLVGKLLEAKDVLLLRDRGAAGVLVYTPLGAQPEDARAVLQGFVDDMLTPIAASLEAAPPAAGQGQ